jgi:hypothetical protein
MPKIRSVTKTKIIFFFIGYLPYLRLFLYIAQYFYVFNKNILLL